MIKLRNSLKFWETHQKFWEIYQKFWTIHQKFWETYLKFWETQQIKKNLHPRFNLMSTSHVKHYNQPQIAQLTIKLSPLKENFYHIRKAKCNWKIKSCISCVFISSSTSIHNFNPIKQTTIKAERNKVKNVWHWPIQMTVIAMITCVWWIVAILMHSWKTRIEEWVWNW